jgi:hypothetical protein
MNMSRAIEGKASNPPKKEAQESLSAPETPDLQQAKREPDIKEWVYRPQVASRE